MSIIKRSPTKNHNDLCVDTPEHKHFLNRALYDCTPNKILGRGSYGTVFKAFYKDKPVAVKLINHSDEMNYNSVISESHICGWNHKNIIQIMLIKKILNYSIIIMERISGYSLKYLIDDQRQISLRHCCRIILDVSQALAFCHKNRLIHLDVKPQNILIQFNDEHSATDKYICKLCDFGASQCFDQNYNNYYYCDDEKHQDRDLKGKFKISGTIRYMSPELLQGLQPMPTDDIYSLAITMWQLKSNYDPYHLIQSNDIIAYRVVKYNLRPDVNMRVFNSRNTNEIQITKVFANDLNKNNKSFNATNLEFHLTSLKSHIRPLISSYSCEENRFKKLTSNSTITLNLNKSNHYHHNHPHLLDHSNKTKKKLCFNKKLILNNNTNANKTNNKNNNKNSLILKRKQDNAKLKKMFNIELKNDRFLKLSPYLIDQFDENPADDKFSNRYSIRYIELYRKCWSVDCTKRPSATEIILILKNFLINK